MYRGAGWNVIKVVWGGDWDALLAQDHDGRLRRRMMECVDGEYQVFKARGGLCARAFLRRGSGAAGARGAPERRADRRAASRRPRSGQVYAAYAAAAPHRQAHRHPGQDGQGYGMGAAGEAANTNHQQKKMADPAVRVPRPLLHPGARRSAGADSVHQAGARQRRAGLFRRGHPARGRPSAAPSGRPRPAGHAAAGGLRLVAQEQRGPRVLDHAGLRAAAGPAAEGSRHRQARGAHRARRIAHLRHGRHVPPVGIYSHVGQLYTPQDADQLNVYREDRQGQILQEGINESGAMASWIAAATAHSTHGLATIPFYIFYSMFGFQRVGDRPGPPATSARAVSSWARPRAAPRWKARACSTTTATATCWPR